MKINLFLDTIKGLSPHTLRAYRQTLWLLWAQMQSKHGTLDTATEPSTDDIRAFLELYNGASLHRHKAAIKAYLEYLGQPWPFTRRQFMAPRRRLPRYTNPDRVPDLLRKAEDEDDAMFIETLFQLGCRISEMLDIEDKNISPAGVIVITKGGNQRLKPVTKEFYTRLKAYSRKHKEGKVFPKKYHYYYMRLKRIGAMAGIDDISPHKLRHARAVDLRRKGMTLDLVQQFLGHANIDTTAVYLEIEHSELTGELEKVEAKANGNGGKDAA